LRRIAGNQGNPKSEVQHQLYDEQESPDHHNVLDPVVVRVHPAPDESVKATDQTQNSFQRTFILEQFDQDDDKANQTSDTY
jgi:hypothetical protein